MRELRQQMESLPGVRAVSVVDEIGIRLALGAYRTDVLRLVAREGMLLVAIGFGLGIPGILLVKRVISAALSGITPFSTSTAIAVGAGLFLVAFMACYLPARRAAALDPTTALRVE